MKYPKTENGSSRESRYQLDPDIERGLRDAVKHNQQSLAWAYALQVIEDLKRDIQDLQSKLEEKPAQRKAPARKATASEE